MIVCFYSSYPSGTLLHSENAYWGDQIKTASDSIVDNPSGGTMFWKRYSVDGREIGKYGANQSTTLWESINLYASFE